MFWGKRSTALFPDKHLEVTSSLPDHEFNADAFAYVAVVLAAYWTAPFAADSGFCAIPLAVSFASIALSLATSPAVSFFKLC